MPKHGQKMPRWTVKQEALLRRFYADNPNSAVAKRIGRSVKSVVSKAHQMGLRKSKKRLREMGAENVRWRYRV